MTKDGWITSHEQVIPSETAVGKQLIDELIATLQKLAWGEQDTFAVHLAVEEALVNAIKHGNQNDRAKNVHVQYNVSADRLHIQIADEGSGFDPQKVPDPTDDENLELPSGRGLMLMRSFMSSIEFNETGNCVVMEKQRTPAD